MGCISFQPDESQNHYKTIFLEILKKFCVKNKQANYIVKIVL